MKTEIYVDVSINLSSFFLKNIGLWEDNDPVDDCRRKLLRSLLVFCLIVSVLICGRDLYFTYYYNGDVLYIMSNNLSLTMSVVKVFIIIAHQEEFLGLIMYMQQHFWNVNYDFHEREILSSCKKICTIFVSGVSLIGICAMLCYIITPFFEHARRNESERVLPFNMWLKLPLSVSPYYEIMFIFQIMNLYYVGICYFCFDNIFCVMAIHLAGQFRILQYRLTTLCNTETQISYKESESMLMKRIHRFYKKLNQYIRDHQALINICDKLETVYTMIILIQVLVFSLLICLFGYQVFLANGPTTRRASFIFLLIGAMCLLFTFTYSCNCVMEHSDNIAIGAYSALWTIMPMNRPGKKLRNDLIMVIMRSRRVCCLTANGFFPVSLETYTSILSTAVSYFTLLRNNVETLIEE
ncbi:PREDICTED: odorant receptor 49b-like [Eufriesea mexicana]|uniref:odorant receptor 49b-like n=1 Tax=Eufriesea mexicana TaxID=516756 RepID=UPI00083C632E|nr:PREDICTED: odorant receptor 49b-like [Eufriesea mexicana]